MEVIDGPSRPAGPVAVLVLCFLFAAAEAPAQYSNRSAVLVGAAGRSSSVACRAIGSAFQPSPVGYGTNATYQNRAGFLGTFVLANDADGDGDGITDENDPDNDNDGLRDEVELSGAAFSPATPTGTQKADTDGDGMNDTAEAAAGTDPLDDESLLRVVRTSIQGGQVKVVWQGRSGCTYQVLGSPTVPGLSQAPTVVATVTASGGVAPWYATQSTGTAAVAQGRGFYRVRKP
jgi:hypothetical protein